MSAPLNTLLAGVLLCVGAVACSAEDQPASSADDAASSAKGLTIRVVDPSGHPVAGARIGPYLEWRGPDLDEPLVYGFGPSGEASVTDENGEISIAYDAFKERLYDEELAVCALEPTKKWLATFKVSEQDLGEVKLVQLEPACEVNVQVKSSELKELGHHLNWMACYVYWGDERPFFSDAKDGRLRFLLPAGKYRFEPYGAKLVRQIKAEVVIAKGTSSLDLDFDMPASKLGHLIGRPAPDLKAIRGWKNSEPISLSELKGQAVVLEFWGHWCGPCVHSMPELVKLYDEFKDQGLQVIAVHDDSVESIEELEKRIAEPRERIWGGKDLPFPIALDGKGTETYPDSERKYRGATVGEYGITSWPTAILIGRDGNVIGVLPYRGETAGRAMLLAALGIEDSSGDEADDDPPQPPKTEKRAVTDAYHGTKVTEHYRWLEDWNDPQVKSWSEAQNKYAREILNSLPNREAIEERVREIMSAETVSYFAVAAEGGKFFALKHQPPKQQPFLIVSDSLADLAGERVLVDPNAMDDAGNASIVWLKPSPDGKLLAVCMASGGDEVGDVTVFDVATGKPVGEKIPRVNTGTAGGDLAWAPDASGFYYTRHPRAGERPAEDMNFYQQVYFHKLGVPTEEDRYEMGKDSPRIAETELKIDQRTGRMLATVQLGDGGEFSHHLRETDGSWHQFTRFEDGVIQAEFGPGDDLFVVSRRDAPTGKIIRVPIKAIVEEANWVARPESANGVAAPPNDAPRTSADLRACHPAIASAKVVVPAGDDAIVTSFWRDSTVLVTDSRLYVVYQLGGPTEIRVFDLNGQPLPAPKQLPVASVGGLEELHGDDVLFDMESYTEPAAVYAYNASSGDVTKTAFDVEAPVSLDDAEVVREFAASKDGTKVPVNILARRDLQRNGDNPTLANAYGGYGVSIQPAFRPLNRVLLDHGFVIAVANVRGGGEYGEQWHLEGNLLNKQNVFDDFAAVLKHLIDRKYTSREKLAIIGGSNGGLLMGATLTQHPQLMKCVVAQVGIYDMLRVELSPNGAFNVTEFGTVKDLEQFKVLYGYSPYHHVEDGVVYPAVLFMTGENDPRVDPMQSRKMVARLQAASPAGGPFLLRTSSNTGHGQGTPLDKRIAQQVDIFAFVCGELDVDFKSRGTQADAQD